MSQSVRTGKYPATAKCLTSEPYYESLFQVKRAIEPRQFELDPSFNPSVEISADGLCAEMKEDVIDYDDHYVCRTTKPIPKDLLIFYFEMTFETDSDDE